MQWFPKPLHVLFFKKPAAKGCSQSACMLCQEKCQVDLVRQRGHVQFGRRQGPSESTGSKQAFPWPRKPQLNVETGNLPVLLSSLSLYRAGSPLTLTLPLHEPLNSATPCPGLCLQPRDHSATWRLSVARVKRSSDPSQLPQFDKAKAPNLKACKA